MFFFIRLSAFFSSSRVPKLKYSTHKVATNIKVKINDDRNSLICVITHSSKHQRYREN